MDALETIEKDGWTAKLYHDEDAQNPRKDCDQLGIMVCWHRNYDLGDRKPTETEQDALQRGGFRLLERYLRMSEGGRNLIKLGLYDHSGITMYAGGGALGQDPGGWDSGTVGFIYTNTEQINLIGAPLESLDRQLHAEIEEYDQYLTGDVYGYVIEDEDGEERDSCWGFFGDDYAKQEMGAALERAMGYERREAAKVEQMMHV